MTQYNQSGASATAIAEAAPPATMQAAVFTVPKTIEIQEIDTPEPGPDQVLVRMEGCGLCASNIPVWQGREWFDYPQEPGAPGHEGWGVVAATGANVQHVQPGDRVAAISYHAYAEYDLADAGNVVKLPDSLSGQPFPGEPLGCAMNIFRRSDVQEGQTVAIVGVGFLGELLVQLCTAAGAKVIAFNRRPFALEMAREQGAWKTIEMDDHQRIIDKVKELTNDELCDRVIEATGKQWPLDLSGELTKVRGKLIVAGFHQDGPRQVNMQLWNWRGLDVINAHERDPQQYVRGVEDAIEAVDEGRMDPAPFFTHTYPLERIDEAFELMEERPEGFIKAMVTFGNNR